MKTLTVNTGSRIYPVHVGEGLLDDTSLFADAIAGRQVLLVSNETVAPLYADRVTTALADYDITRFDLPDGERHKTPDQFLTLIDAMVKAGMNRDTTIVSLGGGVVTDIAGFAAACYQRGVAHIAVPTTLLAQVDAAVGGKTAVNHPRGKNLIGAFHQPAAVIADVDTLDTLDDRQLRAGFAEVIKSALIADREFWVWLCDNAERVLALEADAVAQVIYTSCRIKAEIVAADERERGQRALLNLGHSFAHAIETLSEYGYLHGEAVAIGLSMAADLSVRCGYMTAEHAGAIDALLDRCGLPRRADGIDAGPMLDAMGMDKKVAGGKLRLILLSEPGVAMIRDDYDPALLQAVLSGQPGND